jgi:hypothetical protein
MTRPPVQLDPLNSPHPIPWTWILTTHAKNQIGTTYYRSASLLSPDGQYAAYSRIQMQVQPELYQCRVRSVMFVENRQTGHLQTVSAASPLTAHPFALTEEADSPGMISILMPVSWSESGNQLLAREFEGIFCTGDASDYAVVWHRHHHTTTTLVPASIDYTHAILLGWSQQYPDSVLFKAGRMGRENWPLWAVDLQGRTFAAKSDKPLTFGQAVSHVWAGPQAAC